MLINKYFHEQTHIKTSKIIATYNKKLQFDYFINFIKNM